MTTFTKQARQSNTITKVSRPLSTTSSVFGTAKFGQAKFGSTVSKYTKVVRPSTTINKVARP